LGFDVKTYYELLDVAASASGDEIKRAFRREIAKYHPDKVAHLGKEFQEIASVKASELTEAYKVLTDEALRAKYDELIASGGAAAPRPQPAAPPPPPAPEAPSPAAARPAPEARPHAEPAAPSGSSIFQQERTASSDIVLKVARERFKTALATEFGQYEDLRLQGFEVCAVPKPAFFSMKFPPRVFGRIVPVVDAAAVAEAWTLASRSPRDKQRDLCLFLMGPSVAPAGELAAAINDERRKPWPAGGKMSLVPVNTRTWAAHVPADAPPVVKSLLARLKSA
jgi:curved DNA-binding protein CbpA